MRRLLLQLGEGRDAIFNSRLTLLDGVTEGTSQAVGNGNAHRWIMTCEYSEGCSAGEVVGESGPRSDYAGDWAEEGSSSAGDGTFDRIIVDSSAVWFRARIATPIVGGTVKVYLEAEGEF